MTKYETEEENRDKWFAAVIPAYFIGKAVAQTVFWGLVAMYEWYAVKRAGVKIRRGNYCFVTASILLSYSSLVETEPPWGQLFKRDSFVYSLHRLN